MVEINTLFTFANVLLLIASFPLIQGVWKDRDTLRGFNQYGASLTFVALLTFNMAYIMMENWWSFAISQTTVGFWGLAAVFSWGK